MNLGLEGKYALVTGGSHGIGLAVALALAEEGCHVAICSRSHERLAAARKAIVKKNVQCLDVSADVLIPADIERVMELIVKAWGTLHIVVNNVGGGGRWGTDSIETTPDEVWHQVYDKNTMAAIRFTRLAIPYMRAQKWGRIVTVTSTLGRQAGGRPWFNVAKHAQTCLMKNLSQNKELARDGITFNSVAPGCVMIPDTGWADEAKRDPEAFKRLLDEDFPLGRFGSPDEVAFAVVMLCSVQASLITGAAVAADGGESKSL
ncbi:MAG: SDR family oxidoreductase [Sterolibacterium sp.]|jgi:3-oxoacyl-[acyl-carrier protein] reductase